MSKSAAGRIGGLARQRMHGNVGTPEGRRKGGLNSIRAQKHSSTGFKLLQKIKKPKHSVEYAEFVGIVAGDGHVGPYQITITTNSDTDILHAHHIGRLAAGLFGLTPSLVMRKDARACTITLNSRSVCDILEREGMARGNKIELGVHIPKWILCNNLYKKACVRGLFDADGCVFIDTHRSKGKKYQNMGIAFASKSPELLSVFVRTAEDLGLHPTQTTPFRVFLRRAKEIDIYFKSIGSSNPKHLERYRRFRKLAGGVA